MAKSFWDTEKLVGKVSKNDKGDEIQVRNVSKNDKMFVDVRNYYKNEAGELAPGKGIAIPDDLADEVALMIMNQK